MKNRPAVFVLSFMLLLSLFASTSTASADMGPKPSITVIVKNAPESEYYLDLLVPPASQNKSTNESKNAKYDAVKLNLLEAYDTDGWRAGLAYGTRIPIFGSLTGTRVNGFMQHRFSYMGVPDDYKIIIVTPDNQIKVSKENHKKVFQETVSLDYNTMEVTSSFNMPLEYTKQFLMTFIPTIIIEGIILLLFGFSLKTNWLPFLTVNFTTQLIMTLILGFVLNKSGLLSVYFLFIPIEFCITVAETFVYLNLLKGRSEKRIILYGVTANIASAVAGFFLLDPICTFITGNTGIFR